MAQELTPRAKQELRREEQTRPVRVYVPAVDIWEDERGLVLRADMPGVAPDKVSVEVDEEHITLAGEVDLSAYEGLSPAYTEYNVGHFERRFAIPWGDRFDRDRVQARHKDGVLEVTVPRAEAAKPRRIEVAAE